MTLDELKKALHEADPAAVLVPSHLLSRLIRDAHNLRGQPIQVPHAKSCILDRAVLFRHVDPDDLDLGPERLLPPKVILLARPSLDRRSSLDKEATLRRYWRRLFHARVHLVLEKKATEGLLEPADVEARIEQIGRAEFEEIRTVLQEEHYLFPDATPRDIYIEFAAVYLELRNFFPDLLPIYFPAIRDRARIEQLLAQDVDAAALLAQTQLKGVAAPAARRDESADEPSDFCLKLVRKARQASRAGNLVRAAILRTRAARIAPAALTTKLNEEIAADLDELASRLKNALKLTDDEAAAWRKVLQALLDKTGEEQWSAEARLLYDLQNACVEEEREVYALDLVEWALSVGKRPIKRPLVNQKVVRIGRHLRSAAGRLTATRLSDADRRQLGKLLHDAVHDNEERLRARFRPALLNALHDIGLQAANPPERAALHKLVEELLDRIAEAGFFTYSDLRDALARNYLKLPDLSDPRELVRGDPLLRLDRLLSIALDGVYRPSEIYLRMLQRVTALGFGTAPGRLFTRYVLIPFGAAAALLEGVDLVFAVYEKYLGDNEHVPLFGPLSLAADWFFGRPPEAPFPWLAPLCLAVVGMVLVGLMHVAAVRRAFRHAGEEAARLAREVFLELPARLLPLEALKRFFTSWVFQVVYGLVLKPVPVCLILWLIYPSAFQTVDGSFSAFRAGGIFAAVVLILNTRPGRALDDAASTALRQFLRWVRADLLDGLVRWVLRLFKLIIDGLETVLYTVDELLRFRSGESRASMVLRAMLGLVWFPVSYLVRLYIVVLVEPGFNPIKAPISIVAAKFVYPISPLIGLVAPHYPTDLPEPFRGSWLVWAVAWTTWWLLPDVVGFLVWEMKENWKLYAANRPQVLEAVSIGPRGETLRQLLKPGFHSGPLPKLYRRWREAGREAHQSGAWQPARACREKMEQLEEAVRHFVERDMLALLHQGPGWQTSPLSVGAVALASNMIRVEFRHAAYPGEGLWLAIAEMSGLLVAHVEEVGWARHLPPDQLATLNRAVAGLYKRAGVDLVHEQLQLHLPPGSTFEITDHRLLVHPHANGRACLYDLDQPGPLQPDPAGLCPVLAPAETIFARTPITWHDWVAGWQSAGATNGRPPVLVLPDAVRETQIPS